MDNKKIADSLEKNSILFLKKAIESSNLLDNKMIDTEQMLFLCVHTQLALELVMKSMVISKESLKAILKNGKYDNYSESEIISLYMDNNVTVKSFEDIKNYVKSNSSIFNITKQDIKYIDLFQLYRNKIVHLNYHFNEDEYKQVKVSFIYVLVHIVLKMLSANHLSVSEFLQEHCFDITKVIKNKDFCDEMEKYVAENYEEAWLCPICSRKTNVAELKQCCTCLSEFDNSIIFGQEACINCGKEDSIIYDNLNIDINEGVIDGLCLNCKCKVQIYDCYYCSETFVLYRTTREMAKKHVCKCGGKKFYSA